MKNEDNDRDHQAQENQEATCRIIVESAYFHSVCRSVLLTHFVSQREAKIYGSITQTKGIRVYTKTVKAEIKRPTQRR